MKEWKNKCSTTALKTDLDVDLIENTFGRYVSGILNI